MRTTTSGEDAVLQARQSRHYLRVRIRDSGGTWVAYDDRSSVDWQDDAEITQDSNQRVAQATLRIAREADGNSLAPLINADIDAGRAIEISGARVAAGATPSSGDYKVLFLGVIDRWDCASDPMELIARDDSGLLFDRWVEEETEYGAEDGTVEIEDVMQAILDDWTDSAFTLYTPTSPGFAVTPYIQRKEPVQSALQTLADLIGWVVEYRWDDGTSAFRLTFYEPDRTPSATEWSFDADDYYDVTQLAVDRLDIRNVVTVRYTDSVTEARSSYTATDDASVTKYGRQWMEIEEGEESPIDTDAEAQAMADAIVADLSTPLADQSVEVDLFWPVQLGDFYEFVANNVHYDVDQEYAVTAYTHRWEQGRATTIIQTRGAGAVSHTRGWLEREKRPRDPVEVENGSSLLNFREISRTATQITYAWTLGSDLGEAWVHDYQKPQPYSEDKWPAAGRTPDAVVTDRNATYVVDIPEAGSVGYLQVEGRKLNGMIGQMERVLIFPTSVAGDFIAFAACTVNQSDGSVKITGWTTDRAQSVAYAYNVGAASSTAPPSVSDVESQGGTADGGGLVTGFTSDFEITLSAGTVAYGEVIKGLLVAYINSNGTGPDGTAQDHDTPVGFQGERLKITDPDQIDAGVVIAEKLTRSSQAFNTTIVFSASDWDTVAWSSGSLLMSDGTEYTIDAGNTGNMGTDGARYIYFDPDTSETVLQVTDTATSALGDDVVVLAVAKRAGASDQAAFFVPAIGVFGINETVIGANSISTSLIQANAITAAKIGAGEVTAAKIDVAYLRAITADLGNVVTGYISNSGNTAAIKLSTSTADPDGIPTLPSTNFIDLTATSTDPFIKHAALELLANGTATFSGALSAASGSFAGDISSATGTFSGTVAATSFTGSTATFTGKVAVEDGAGATRVLLQRNLGYGAVVVYDSSGNNSGGMTAQGTQDLNVTAIDELILAGVGVRLSGNLGFYGGTPAAQPTVTGSRGGNAALASLLSALDTLGLVVDSSS